MFSELMVMVGRCCESITALAFGILMMGVVTLVATVLANQGLIDARCLWIDQDAVAMNQPPSMEIEAVGPDHAADQIMRWCEPIEAAMHRHLHLVERWYGMVALRLRVLAAVVVMAIPLALAWWMIGRRQAYQALSSGVPARDATRIRWLRLSNAIALVLGAVTATPHVSALTEVTGVLVIAACGAQSRVRASSAASLAALEPA